MKNKNKIQGTEYIPQNGFEIQDKTLLDLASVVRHVQRARTDVWLCDDA